MKRTLIAWLIALSLIAFPGVAALAQSGCATRHTVQRGENLFRIGLRYGLAWPAIASANTIGNPNRIFVGQVLCIPTVRLTSTPSATQTITPRVTPTPAATATPITAPGLIPRFTIVSVTRDQAVTISAFNFPANRTFTILMGPIGTRGLNGTQAGTQNSGTGVFTATYSIPANLKGAAQIAIRLQEPGGHFSYNWFHNATSR